MKISRKFKPLFDLPKAWGEIETLSYLELSSEDSQRLEELIHQSESKDLEETERTELKELRFKGLTEKQSTKLEYWTALGGVSKVSITGGRESSKTFTASLASTDRVVNYGYRELYTRYTMKAASKSVIPSFLNRAKALGYTPFLKDTLTSVRCESSGGYVDFSGIKASSGNQSANLKSLEDYAVFTVEEGEEFPTFEEWEKIELSFRSRDVQPFSVFIMNPSTKKFWWYVKNYKDKGVKAGHNGIVGDTLYIHTTYLDLGKKYVAKKNWDKYEAARVVYERIEALSKDDQKKESKNDIRTWKYYKFTVLGGWKDSEEGLVYPDYELFKEFPTEYRIRIYGLDFGFSNDPLGFVECVIANKNDLYLKQHIYKTGLLNRQTIPMIKAIVKDLANTYIVADCSDPKEIAEFRAEGIALIPADKTYKGNGPSKMRGIRQMQNFNWHIHEDSQDLIDEVNHYHFIEIINAKGETVTHVVDKDDHLLDPSLYAATRY